MQDVEGGVTMTEFDNLKNSYIAAIHWGLAANASYHEAKQGNDILHKFCESLVESSNCLDSTKIAMKQELELLKEALSKEIDSYYRG